MKNSFVMSLCVTIIPQCICAQTPTPPNLSDPIWTAYAPMSDEFNDGVIDNTKWTWAPPWGTYHGNPTASMACLSNSSTNRQESGGSLKLTVTQETSTCNSWDGTPYTKPFKVGALYSLYPNTIKYGYFEVRVKIPDHNANNTDGFGPNFWFWKLLAPLDGKWSEIDVFEFNAASNTHTCNVHYESDYVAPVVLDHWAMRQSDVNDIENVNFNGQWHVFSCEWSPERINFFMDGIYITGTSQYCADQLPLNLILDINVPATNFGYSTLPSGVLLPYTFEIDYVRTYQKQMDCNTEELVCTLIPSNLYALKKKITFQNYCGITLPAGTHNYRATDYIQIMGDFTVNYGTQMLLDTEPCY
jgi:beta-glucanase (GH16 family)